MNRTCTRKWLSVITLLAILTNLLPQAAWAGGAEPLDWNKLPRLQITELTPDTANFNGSDAYEFIEVYNNTDQPVDFKQNYDLVYRDPAVGASSDTVWSSADAAISIPSQSNIVFWVMNSDNPSKTVAEFNANFKTSLQEHVNLFRVSGGGGMHNSKPRDLIIKDKQGAIVSMASYQTDDQTKPDKGIFYAYPTDGTVNQVMMDAAGTLAATPGIIDAAQVPAVPVKGPAQPEPAAPVITHTPLTQTASGADVSVSAQIAYAGASVSAAVYYKNASAAEFVSLPMKSVTGSVYQAAIPKAALSPAGLDYYIQAQGGAKTAKTETYRVQVTSPGEPGTANVPPLLITELVPDSVNVENTSSDAYEYMEVYNNADRAVNLRDYKLQYRYTDESPNRDVEWPLGEKEMLIPSQQSIVLWVINDANKAKTAADFNANYNTALTENTNLFRISSGGMANGGKRGLVLQNAAGKEVVAAYYDNDDQTKPDKGIFYQYPTDGGTKMTMQAAPGTLNGTPGAIAPGQVPSKPVPLPDIPKNQPPVIVHTPVTKAKSGADLELYAHITDPDGAEALTAKLYYKTQSQQTFEAVDMKAASGGNYKAVILKTALTEAALQYYIEASDGVNKAKTATYTVGIDLPAFDPQKAPMLLVTELTPDSTNIGSADGYEFIELYNNTDRELSLKDYTMRYRNPDAGPTSDVIWGADKEDAVIPSKGTLVFWIINSQNTAATVADFNTNYHTNLVEGKDIVRIYSDGMSNAGKRGLVIATKSGIDISGAYYDNDDQTKPDKGIFYKYPVDGTTKMLMYSAGVEASTPGSVNPVQVPAVPVHVTDDTKAPVFKDLTGVQEINQSGNLELVGEAKDDKQVKSVILYFKTDKQADYTKRYLTESYADTLYHHKLFSPDLIGRGYVEYYFVVSDGTNTVTTEKKRVLVKGGADNAPLRLNVKDGDVLSKTSILKATGQSVPSEQLALSIDGVELKKDTYRAVEQNVFFAFEASGVDYYFKNAVTADKEILYTFLDPIPTYTTLSVPIQADRIKAGSNVFSIRAGSKSSPFDDRKEENKDDFEVRNVRLVLADGTELYDSRYADPQKVIKMGDSAGKNEFIDFNFVIPDNQVNSKAYAWQTAAVADGIHQIAVSHSSAPTVSAAVKVDNTAPEIKPSIQEGVTYRGAFTLDAVITDRLAGVDKTEAALDGQPVKLPYSTSSAGLKAGAHTFVVTATDKVGNAASQTVNFTVPEENPNKPELVSPKAGAAGVDRNAALTVKADDPTQDNLDVSFYRGFRYDASAGQGFTGFRGSAETEPPKQEVPVGEQPMAADDYDKIRAVDGKYLVDDATERFPYHRFEIALDPSVKATDKVDIVWNGKSLEGRKVSLYAWSSSAGEWKLLDTRLAGSEDFELRAAVIAGDYASQGKIRVMVQDELPVSNDRYDFSFVWMSDTQYYSESFPYIYQGNVKWIVDNLQNQKIKYVIHTGDIVDEADKEYQWVEADKDMKVLEAANVPYGVLAGNHDVGHQTGDYTQYWKYFGENRFKRQPTFGGSYDNNRGHYDLVSAGGNDFIIVYMGWGVNDADIDWMDQVLKQYPNRKAILAFHEFLLVSGNRAPIADKVFERVVKPNKNVFAVLSGHYHDAELKVDAIDDNGDGQPDRNVYQMLADYQGAPEGGLGYIRLMQFDMVNNKLHMKTYSPYLNDYNFYDPTEYPGKDEFSLNLNLEPVIKRVATDYVGVLVHTDAQIGAAKRIASGKQASVVWNGLKANTEYEWYAVAQDSYGGRSVSDIWKFTTGTQATAPSDDGNNSGGSGSSGSTPEPSKPVVTEAGVIQAQPKPDGTYTVDAAALTTASAKSGAAGAVEIRLAGEPAEGGAYRVELSGEGVQAAQRQKSALRIVGPSVTVTIPASAWPADTAGARTLTLQVGTPGGEETRAAIAAATGKDTAYAPTGLAFQLELNAGDGAAQSAVHRFNGSVTVQRTLTTEQLRGVNPDFAGVYYLNGTKAEYIGGTFAGNQLTFETNHFSRFAVLEYRKQFADMRGHWAQTYVQKLAAKHIAEGVSADRFAPDQAVTRADWTVLAVKALGYTEPANRAAFNDVAPGKYYAAYVGKAKELGLIEGDDSGAFRPEDTMTREETAVLLGRLYNLAHKPQAPAAGASAAFADSAQIAGWALPAVQRAQALGLIDGKDGNRFDPKAGVTRAETAKLVLGAAR